MARTLLDARARTPAPLAALTNNGEERSFSVLDLQRIAAFLEYVNHDGCMAAEVRRLLETLAAVGQIRLSADSGELLREWP